MVEFRQYVRAIHADNQALSLAVDFAWHVLAAITTELNIAGVPENTELHPLPGLPCVDTVAS